MTVIATSPLGSRILKTSTETDAAIDDLITALRKTDLSLGVMAPNVPVSRSTLYRIIGGSARPSVEEAAAIADYIHAHTRY